MENELGGHGADNWLDSGRGGCHLGAGLIEGELFIKKANKISTEANNITERSKIYSGKTNECEEEINPVDFTDTFSVDGNSCNLSIKNTESGRAEDISLSVISNGALEHFSVNRIGPADSVDVRVQHTEAVVDSYIAYILFGEAGFEQLKNRVPVLPPAEELELEWRAYFHTPANNVREQCGKN